MIDEKFNTLTLTTSRTVAAPPDQVFRAWTEPALLARWWWPARFSTVYEIDLRPGGKWRFYTVDTPDMGVLSVSGTYQVVEPPSHLVYTWTWAEADAVETLVAVDFIDREGQTEVLVRYERFNSEQSRNDHAQGWNDSLDRLTAFGVGGDMA